MKYQTSAPIERHHYPLPLLLALSTAVGLASALFGEGLWDIISWVALALPFAVLAKRLRLQTKNSESLET